MAVVDQHSRDTSLPSQFLSNEDDDIILRQSQEHNPSNNNNANSSSSSSSSKNNNEFGSSHVSPLVRSGEAERNDMDDDFIAELAHQMAHSTLQDNCEFDFSGIFSQNLELSWDLMGSPQSTLWSPLGSNQGSSEGSSQEPSPPATPAGNGNRNSQLSCWKMKLDERGNSKYHHPAAGNGIQSLKTSKSNIGQCSYQSLIQEQIRAIQLSRLKQEQVLSLKQELSEGSQGQKSHSQQSKSEPKEQIQQFQKKGKRGSGGGGGGYNGRRTRCSTRPAPLQSLQQAGSGMRALFLGGSGSRSGTGVFLPRGGGTGTNAPPEPRMKPGKGCSTVLIPARVVQALQLHFDQMAAASGPKAGGFPPLHDVLGSNRDDGMYSPQKRQSRKEEANIQNEMILPREWTY